MGSFGSLLPLLLGSCQLLSSSPVASLGCSPILCAWLSLNHLLSIFSVVSLLSLFGPLSFPQFPFLSHPVCLGPLLCVFLAQSLSFYSKHPLTLGLQSLFFDILLFMKGRESLSVSMSIFFSLSLPLPLFLLLSLLLLLPPSPSLSPFPI